MAAISRCASGLPSAIVMRSASSRTGSCQGKSSGSGGGSGGGPRDGDDAAELPAAAPPYRPARNPFSQARCAGENGALSGISGSGGLMAFISRRDREKLGHGGEFGFGVARGERLK